MESVSWHGSIEVCKTSRLDEKESLGDKYLDEIIDRLDKSEDPISEGEKICIELIDQIKDLPGIDGVHLMDSNCESQSANIIKALT